MKYRRRGVPKSSPSGVKRVVVAVVLCVVQVLGLVREAREGSGVLKLALVWH